VRIVTCLPDSGLFGITVDLACRVLIFRGSFDFGLLFFTLFLLRLASTLLFLRCSLLLRQFTREEFVEKHLIHWDILNLFPPELFRVDVSLITGPGSLVRDYCA